ncbi:methionine abc transporter substrate-binding protein [Lasius niger]|uniref:Methionine abc transporter substrate-binding protein n=1 Tax=Lasius niger TaxID=67767 RepID=A0A0J7K7T7_LASNI|nr:methionine abc transporter substrate-binding protein [Lasius niger]
MTSILRRDFFRTLSAAALALCGCAAILNGPAFAQENKPSPELLTLPQAKTITVGIISGEDEDVWRVVQENAKKANLTIKVTPFSDYTAPNIALAEHDLDANAFQHQPYLEAQRQNQHFHITRVGDTYFQPIGLYSVKYKSAQDLPKNAVVGVPNDPSNEGRALHLLEKLGLLKIAPNSGTYPTALDITENPKNITIKELDAGIVGRSLPDLSAAVVNTDWARKAGIDLSKSRIGAEALKDNPYVNFIAVNDSDLKKPWVKILVQSFQQPNVATAIRTAYHDVTVPAFSS